MFYSYVLKSLKDGKRYSGVTSNVKRRLGNHNEGKVSSTKPRRPLELVHFEKFNSFEEARKRELYFKSGAGRESLDGVSK